MEPSPSLSSAQQQPFGAQDLTSAFSDSLPAHQSKQLPKVVALLEARIQGSSRHSLPDSGSDKAPLPPAAHSNPGTSPHVPVGTVSPGATAHGISPARKRRRKPVAPTKTDLSKLPKPRKRARKHPATAPQTHPVASPPQPARKADDAVAAAATPTGAATAAPSGGTPGEGAGGGVNVHVAEENNSRSSTGARMTDFFKYVAPHGGKDGGESVDLTAGNSSGSDRSRGSARSSGSRRAAAFKSKPTSSSAGVSPARGVFGSSSSFRMSPGHHSGTPRRRASDTAASGAGTAGAPRGSATPAANTTAGAGAASSRPAPASASAAAAAELKATAARYAAEVERLQSQVSSLKAREQALCTALDAEREAREAAQAQEAEAAQARAAVLEGLFRDVIRRDVAAHRRQLAEDQFKVGRIVTHRTSPHNVLEVWEDGHELREIVRKQKELATRKAALDKRKRLVGKAVRKAAALAKAAASGAMIPPPTPTPQAAGSAGVRDLTTLTGLDLIEADELVKTQVAQLKREEVALTEARASYDAKKALLLRELKRVQDEEQSRFVHRPVLNSRYLLMSLLGKGGFSEVWRAMDLVNVCEVAVKIHQLSSHWHDAKKANYIRHATREYAIHKTLVHRHVVRMHDVFEIDNNSFATVLDLCHGSDLDRLLKQERTLGEREARSITVQVLSALRYLHGHRNDAGESQSQCIIHYDLKPGNILLDGTNGVKVTDFGLSKILDGDGTDVTSMELTSQGAGTYWYLPPECFQTGHVPARISPKVDVWSLGVILFEMLYGKRPFGDGQSQDRLLLDKVILRARHVDFPTKPAVSDVTKDFISKCLSPDQSERPNVVQLCDHPFLKAKLRA